MLKVCNLNSLKLSTTFKLKYKIVYLTKISYLITIVKVLKSNFNLNFSCDLITKKYFKFMRQTIYVLNRKKETSI